MCGLVAAITKNRNGFNQENQNVFEFLLWLDTLRGDDSTGAFLVTNEGNVAIAKGTPEGTQFVKKDEYKALRGKAWSSGWAMVGHNRKATRGSIKDENAHPFWVDDKLVLVHNGSYNGDHKHLKDVEVDSNAIAHHLAEADDIEKALQKVNAAYALIWYDVEQKSLKLIRNSERPLCFMDTDNAIYVASEGWMLSAAAYRYGIKNIKNGPKLLPEYELVEMNLQENKSTEIETAVIDGKYRYPSNGRVGSTFFPGQTPNWSPFACGYECGDYEWEGHPLDRGLRYPTNEPVPERSTVDAANEAIQEAVETSKEERSKTKETDIFGDAPLDGKRKEIVEMTLEALSYKYKETTFKKFREFADCDHYKRREGTEAPRRLRCVVKDFVEAEDKPKTTKFMFVGQDTLNPQVYVAFPYEEKDFEKLIGMPELGIFEVEVAGHMWNKINMHGSTTMDDWGGIFVVIGANAKPIYQQKVEQRVH